MYSNKYNFSKKNIFYFYPYLLITHIGRDGTASAGLLMDYCTENVYDVNSPLHCVSTCLSELRHKSRPRAFPFAYHGNIFRSG